jgi:hypothetical protein
MLFNKEYAMSILNVLKGAKLLKLTRAAQMPCFQFSDALSGSPKFQLHIQCSFRFVSKEKVVVASSDVYQPNSSYEVNNDFDFENFEWDIVGQNRFDEIVKNIITPNMDFFIIESIELSAFGDLRIYFSNDFVLDVYIDTSGSEECWRFFNKTNSNAHLVITGLGIEDFDD